MPITDPLLLRQWHPLRNGDLSPGAVRPGSHKKVWWRCGRGHRWQASVAARTAGEGCPVCAGKVVVPGENDLATLFPQVAAQWHPTLNGPLTPNQVTAGSRKTVWWQCPEGHAWKARVHPRTGPQRCGCPICAGRTRTASRDPPPLAG